MKRYRIDVQKLDPQKREEVLQRLEDIAFIATPNFRPGKGTLSIDVFWDREEDFLKADLFPENCPCREL